MSIPNIDDVTTGVSKKGVPGLKFEIKKTFGTVWAVGWDSRNDRHRPR